MTHFEQAADRWGTATAEILAFGYEMMLAIDTEGRTIREMSVKLCGNEGLEDRIGRWVMAARFEEALRPHPLYEDARDWLTPSHMTELYKVATQEDTPAALDLMEETFIRNVTDEIVEVKSVAWLQAKRSKDPTTAEVWARVSRVSEQGYLQAVSEVERLGNDATPCDRARVKALRLVQKLFTEAKNE